MLHVDEHLYKFLVDMERARMNKEEEGLGNEKIDEIRREYMENKGTGKTLPCVLIPCGPLMKIVGSNRWQWLVLNDVLSLGTDSTNI